MRKSLMRGALRGLPILAGLLMLSGCDAVLFDPKGPIGESEKSLILTATYLMLVVVIPVIFMTLWFAWRYRDTKQSKATYTPNWAHSTKIEIVVWGIPCLIILALGILTWKSTHELDPRAEIQDGGEPIEVQVVSMDWKWLFIYPEQNIATVNYVAFPKDVPVTFKLTSDNIMNAFFIPRLGSQIYAMPGMVTKLNLIANHEGDFKGFASNYSGKGFSQMKFTASAMPDQVAFLNWVEKVKASPDRIEDWEQFRSLAAPSVAEPVTLFSSIPPFLFTDVVTQHPGSMNCLPETQG